MRLTLRPRLRAEVARLAEQVDRLERLVQANCQTCRGWLNLLEVDGNPITTIGSEPWRKAGGCCPSCGREPEVIRLALTEGERLGAA